MKDADIQPWDGAERRKSKERRSRDDRRSNEERRNDPRDGTIRIKKSLLARIRTLTKSRLGVDRRHDERRTGLERRYQAPSSILTREEINELLS